MNSLGTELLIRSRGGALISGLMGGSTKVTGKTIRCTAGDCIPGLMGGFIRASIGITGKKDTENTLGLMAKCILASGARASSTVKGNLCCRAVKREFHSGLLGKGEGSKSRCSQGLNVF